ncbi:MAG TPA: PKD domain-containing protein [Solirubrobacteraceae bacterium]
MTNTRKLTALLAVSISLTTVASAQAAPVWTPPTDLSTLTDSNSDVMVDVTPSGESAVMLRDGLGAGKYGFRVSLHRPGAAVSKQIMPSGGSSLVTPSADGAIDLAASGRGIVAWDQSNGLFYALRSPAGVFGSPHQLTGLPTANIGSVKVGLDDAGNATFLWTTATGTNPTVTSRVYSIQRRADGVLVNPQTLATFASSQWVAQTQSLRVNASGAAVASWRTAGPGPGEVQYATRHSSLGTLGAGAPVQDAFAIDGAMDKAGDTAVAMSTLKGLQVRYRPAGGAFGAPATIGTANGPPSVALAGNGTATVLWENLQGANDVLLSCSFTTAGCIKPAVAVATDPASLGGGQLAVNSSGAAVAFWSSDAFGAATVRARMRSSAGTWGAQQTVGTLHSIYGSAGIDDAGNAVAAWRYKGAAGLRAQIAAFDVTAPKLSTVSVPPQAVAGTAVKLSATASDNWGPLALKWTFGDGASASGAAVSHTYVGPGTRTVTVTATDASGNAVSQKRSIAVAPAP